MKLLTFFYLISLSTFALELEPLLQEAHNITDIQLRVEHFSQRFIGQDYDPNGPLGEGSEGEIDQDPLYRFDRFDCTTFVETVLALAKSYDPKSFKNEMNLIRYNQGEIDFLKRHHFTDLQWIPENVKEGLFIEANEIYFSQKYIHIAEAIIDIKGWVEKFKPEQLRLPQLSTEEKEQRLLELRRKVESLSPQLARVSYIQINDILNDPNLLDKLPSVMIINFVRPNWNLKDTIGTNMNISHQGIIIKKNDVLFMRHATQVSPLKVVEIPLLTYLSKYKDHPSLKGVHFLEIL